MGKNSSFGPILLLLLVGGVLVVGFNYLFNSTPIVDQVFARRFGVEVADVTLTVSGIVDPGNNNFQAIIITNLDIRIDRVRVFNVDEDFVWATLSTQSTNMLITLTRERWSPRNVIQVQIPIPINPGSFEHTEQIGSVPTGQWRMDIRLSDGWTFDSPDGPTSTSRLITI